MAAWIETYRGTVSAWECDITEHFTIAYYFDRLGEAERSLTEVLGLREFLRGGGFSRRYEVRFVRELRAGASFHIESAPIGLGIDGVLRLGHRVINSATGETVTWIDELWDLPHGAIPTERRSTLGDLFVHWDGPASEPRPEPARLDGFIASARGRVKPADLSVDGRFGLAAMVHRFTDSSVQTGAAIGMDADYLAANRRGFSTFELALRITGSLALDEMYLIETGIAHLGNSSLRFVHRMVDPRSGSEVARLSQYGVNLDLDARRPTKWPDDVRKRATALVVPLEDAAPVTV
ncbi:MAG TPA: thioesterase family protein [Stellaceae bacterium]|jgi:acyl-CoA thioesterase FadM|nr:thioesterase family protein [Stellaceae bacterium]